MKTVRYIFFVVLGVALLVPYYRGNGSVRNNPVRIVEENVPNLSIKEGYISQKNEAVKIVRSGRVLAEVKLGDPVMVAQAEQEEKWGYFQFPIIGRAIDGRLIVSWQMNADSHTAYGKGNRGKMMSLDEGKTWLPLDKSYVFKYKSSRILELSNGNTLLVTTPVSKDVKSYNTFPTPVYRDKTMGMNYYLESELPEDLRGVYLSLRDSIGRVIINFHGELDDPGLLRYDIDNLMPLKWWGDIKEMADGSFVAGIYPSCYLNENNELPKSDITFYRSTDSGYHWKAIGNVPYEIEKIKDKRRQYDRYQGFSEATFEILKDSTFFCVIRTGYNTPMYKTFSYDRGEHWTEPVAFTSNGVRPQLLLLDNGVMVMASGRPGVQLRFCLNGDGNTWTEPIEMLSFMDENGEYDVWGRSCGYANLFPAGENRFYMVYSDFKTRNKQGDYRKSIIFREIELIEK